MLGHDFKQTLLVNKGIKSCKVAVVSFARLLSTYKRLVHDYLKKNNYPLLDEINDRQIT